MLHVAYACGLRVAELVSLRLEQFDIRTPPSIRVMGKGRRERVLPLWKETTAALNAWLKVRQANGAPELFPNACGRAMTRAGFEYILDKHVSTASKEQSSIAKKRVTPHVLRHSCAMHILQATGDIRKVSLWLGHASMQSTEIYLRSRSDRETGCSRYGDTAGSQTGQVPGARQTDGDVQGGRKPRVVMQSVNRLDSAATTDGRRQLRITISSAYYRTA